MWSLTLSSGFGGVMVRAALLAYGGSQAREQIRAAPEAFATATAMRDPSCVCDLHRSSRQHRNLNPLSEARDRIPILMDPYQGLNLMTHDGNSFYCFFFFLIDFVEFPSWLSG